MESMPLPLDGGDITFAWVQFHFVLIFPYSPSNRGSDVAKEDTKNTSYNRLGTRQMETPAFEGDTAGAEGAREIKYIES